MKAFKICSPASDGFLGYFYPAENHRGRCMMILAGDDGNDFMDQAFARWFTKYQDCSALCIALRQVKTEDSGLSLWNLNTILEAVSWLRSRDYSKIGICGISMQAVIALSAAARIPEISLTMAFTPCDYVPWGFKHGPVGNSKNAEYPTGKSLLIWKGKPLPFQDAGMNREEYWALYESQSHRYHEMHSRVIFERSEERSPVPKEAFIPVENIRGAVVLIGAEDDSMWNCTRYIHRMRYRLLNHEFIFPVKLCTYAHGTHLLLPQRMLMDALPVIGGMVSMLFSSGRRHPGKCRAARICLDRTLSAFLQDW